MKNNCMIDATARVGNNLSMGFNNLIFENVIIGDDVEIGNNVIIHPNTTIGDRVKIFDNAVVAKRNFLSSGTGSSKELFDKPAVLKIADDVIIGTGAILYAGSEIGQGSIVADCAIVREGCRFGKNVKVGKNSIVEYQVVLEDDVSVQAFVLVGEMMTIGSGTFLGPHVSTACDTYMNATEREALDPPRLKSGIRVGSNVTILPGIEIGDNSIVSAGSVVARDIPKGVVAIGFPAKPIKRIRPDK